MGVVQLVFVRGEGRGRGATGGGGMGMVQHVCVRGEGHVHGAAGVCEGGGAWA